MKIRTVTTTTVYDNVGGLFTEVTTAREATIGDNPRYVRRNIASEDLYGQVASTNLDQVEAAFTREAGRA